jgi:hypothetical protein
LAFLAPLLDLELSLLLVMMLRIPNTLHPCGFLRLRELLVANKVVPALAPHVDVLAAITGMTLDLLHIVVRGLLGLLICRTTSACGRGHH